ncbi:molybdenum cofactor biosynthesis protein MoeA [Corynebacterium sphenisci DSM 44792]|uniref:GTP 3',8-cyclase n=1 Tax=Corynebacterium sphenisci DSM 44792 TaxID=1437874 RepID=A0A1L7CX42_9CORY|nr:molybdenum cofactor biosynthesis protein MoeA [Corynebacterium sphenisci DSM 44792]
MADDHGRVARDLRVSLTDRCNLRCTYCMPAEGLPWLPPKETLTTAEFIRLITIGVRDLGIRRVRLTGGEPLLHRDLAGIIAAAKALTTDAGAAPEVALTTNGLGLAHRAAALAAAGLDRVNVSLDTLDPDRHAMLTRRKRLPDVLAGIDAARAAGLTPVKLNAVVLPGVNEADILPLARHALARGLRLRFIEQMPLGPSRAWSRGAMVTAGEILARLGEAYELTPAAAPRGAAPAALWRAVPRAGGPAGEIGVIASVTAPFCGDCDRTRLTADGAVRACLFSRGETPLRELLRAGAGDAEIAAAWAATMRAKPAGHGIGAPGFRQPGRPMSAIGG